MIPPALNRYEGQHLFYSKLPSVLLATNDSDIRASMSELLQNYPINILWASGTAELKFALATKNIVACFSSFWLVDGTYRDVVRHLKRERPETPVVVICAPSCPDEYRDYWAALNITAFDFLCHPYRRLDLEKILDSAMVLQNRTPAMQVATGKSPVDSFATGLHRAS